MLSDANRQERVLTNIGNLYRPWRGMVFRGFDVGQPHFLKIAVFQSQSFQQGFHILLRGITPVAHGIHEQSFIHLPHIGPCADDIRMQTEFEADPHGSRDDGGEDASEDDRDDRAAFFLFFRKVLPGGKAFIVFQ